MQSVWNIPLWRTCFLNHNRDLVLNINCKLDNISSCWMADWQISSHLCCLVQWYLVRNDTSIMVKGYHCEPVEKGWPTWMHNRRGITLLNTIYNKLAMVIKSRLTFVEYALRGEQDGFRPHRIIVEQSLEGRSPFYIHFFGYKKDFITIKRNSAWVALSSHLIQGMYKSSELAVLHNDNFNLQFARITGLR